MARNRKQQDRRTFKRRDLRTPEDTGDTSEDIEAKLATAGPPVLPANVNGVVKMKRDAIYVAEQVFQWRQDARNMVPRHNAIFDMARALWDKGDVLPPITVFPVGRNYFVMDGHHRLAAYDTAGWTEAIRVQVFTGSLRDAERAAMKANSRDKLPMSKPDKFNAAWRLVKQEYPKDTVPSIADTASIARSTVDNMRAALKKLKTMGVTKEVLKDMPWNAARDKAKGREEWKGVDPDWIKAEAQKLVKQLSDAKLITQLIKRPQVTALALSMLADGFVEALVAEFGYGYGEEPEDREVAAFAAFGGDEDLSF